MGPGDVGFDTIMIGPSTIEILGDILLDGEMVPFSGDSNAISLPEIIRESTAMQITFGAALNQTTTFRITVMQSAAPDATICVDPGDAEPSVRTNSLTARLRGSD